ncbi:MAG: hypothetical protein ACLVEE_18240 [Phocaeicola vulgatus]
MLKYEIDGKGCVIYSPGKRFVLLYRIAWLSELTPWQLAFVLSLDMQQMKERG